MNARRIWRGPFVAFAIFAAAVSITLLLVDLPVPKPPEQSPLPAAAATTPEEIPDFRRGINLSRLLSFAARDPDTRTKYRWPPFEGLLSEISNDELVRLKALGFDFVRLPVDAGPFLAASIPEQKILLDLLDSTIRRILEHRLTVLVDMHPANYASVWRPEDILSNPEGPTISAYEELLVNVAQRLRDLPASEVALELMNEPQPECWKSAEDDWTTFQLRLYQTVRSAAPNLPIVLTGGCWSSIAGLDYLDPTAFDTRTLFDVHFYSPHEFTHQSLPWSSPPLRYVAGLSYPWNRGSVERAEKLTRMRIDLMKKAGTLPPEGAFDEAREQIWTYYHRKKPELKKVEARFDAVSEWASKYGISPDRIVIGEFSAVRPPKGIPEDGSRLRWLLDVRKAMESRNYAWALWDYYEGFGLLTDNAARTIDVDTASALGLNTSVLETATNR